MSNESDSCCIRIRKGRLRGLIQGNNERNRIWRNGRTCKNRCKGGIGKLCISIEQCKKQVPEILQGDYELVYEFDIEALLKHLDGTVMKTALSKASGINVMQLSHYSSGLKNRAKSILSALRFIRYKNLSG